MSNPRHVNNNPSYTAQNLNWRPDNMHDGGYSTVDWNQLPASTPAINDRVLLYLILKAMKDGALDDLRSLEKTISENNQKKAVLRDIRKQISKGVSTDDDGKHKFDKSKVETIQYQNPESGAVETLDYAGMQALYQKMTGESLNATDDAQVLTNIDNDISTLGDFGQELATKMQLYNQRFTEASDLLTGILNSWHGAIKKIIGNIGQA